MMTYDELSNQKKFVELKKQCEAVGLVLERSESDDDRLRYHLYFHSLKIIATQTIDEMGRELIPIIKHITRTYGRR